MDESVNVLGGVLEPCSNDPETGWFRDGCCNTDRWDLGSHTVCVLVDEEFLAFSKQAGNDLSTPMPENNFPGLKEGDRWCLCASRWKQAYEMGSAPPVILASTHIKALEDCKLSELEEHAVEIPEPQD
jgi:uncharacterized protein (DUF2237 family)